MPASGTNNSLSTMARARSKSDEPCVAETVSKKSENSSRSFFSSNCSSSFGCAAYVTRATRVASSWRTNALAIPRANDFILFHTDSSVAPEPSKMNAMSAEFVHSVQKRNERKTRYQIIYHLFEHVGRSPLIYYLGIVAVDTALSRA